MIKPITKEEIELLVWNPKLEVYMLEVAKYCTSRGQWLMALRLVLTNSFMMKLLTNNSTK